jgi:hypothetical protein
MRSSYGWSWKLLLLVLFSSGCTYRYTAQHYPLEPERIPYFAVTDTVSVINDQSSDEDLIFKTAGPHKWVCSLRQLTDVASEGVRKEFRIRDTPVGEDGQKVLRLAVTGAQIEEGMWKIRGIVDLDVETGTGLKKRLIGNNSTPGNLNRALNGAIALAIIELFKDEDIMSYLGSDY